MSLHLTTLLAMRFFAAISSSPARAPIAVLAAVSLCVFADQSMAAVVERFLTPGFDRDPSSIVETEYQGKRGWIVAGDFGAWGGVATDGLAFIAHSGEVVGLPPAGFDVESAASIAAAGKTLIAAGGPFYLYFHDGETWDARFLGSNFSCNGAFLGTSGPGLEGYREGPIVKKLDTTGGQSLWAMWNDSFEKLTGDGFRGPGLVGVLDFELVARPEGELIVAGGGIPVCDEDRWIPYVRVWNGESWDPGWGGSLPLPDDQDALVLDIAPFGPKGNEQVVATFTDKVHRVAISDGTEWHVVATPIHFSSLSTFPVDGGRRLIGWGVDPTSGEIASFLYDQGNWLPQVLNGATRLAAVVEVAESLPPAAMFDRFMSVDKWSSAVATLENDAWVSTVAQSPDHQGVNGFIESMSPLAGANSDVLFVVGRDITLAGLVAVDGIARRDDAGWSALPPVPGLSARPDCCRLGSTDLVARQEGDDEVVYVLGRYQSNVVLRFARESWTSLPLPASDTQDWVRDIAVVDGRGDVFVSLTRQVMGQQVAGVWQIGPDSHRQIAEFDVAPTLEGGSIEGDFELLALGGFSEIDGDAFDGRAYLRRGKWNALSGPPVSGTGSIATCDQGSLQSFYVPQGETTGGGSAIQRIVYRSGVDWAVVLEESFSFGGATFSFTAGCVASRVGHFALGGRALSGGVFFPYTELYRLTATEVTPAGLGLTGGAYAFADSQHGKTGLYVAGDYQRVNGAPVAGLMFIDADAIFVTGDFEPE